MQRRSARLGSEAAPVIATVGLLILLVIPTLVWLIVRYRPKDGGEADRRAGKVTASGVKHRWWQP